MRTLRRLGVAAALLTLASARATADDAAPSPLVVHEWGTFTSVQGSDGVGLEGLQREEEALPDFVYDRTKLRACPLRAKGWKGLEVPVHHVTQKMETPVLYFHTATPRRLRVRVDFVDGLISQWYPVVDTLGPPEGACDAGPLDLRTVKRSFLAWDVDLIPKADGTPAPAGIPSTAQPTDPWNDARAVDAAYVRTRPRVGPDRAGPVEAEHFLFYRGLGTFTLPMRVELDPLGRPSFVNDADHDVAAVVGIEVRDDGKEGRYDVLAPFDARRRVASKAHAEEFLAGRPFEAWGDGGSPGLRSDLTKVLVSQGLALDEARAMIATWSHSWFSAPGMRVLYVVPRPLVDALLPLTIDPKPDAIVRVLLGRIECLPPARVAAMAQALATIGTAGADGPGADPTAAGAAAERVRVLGGRFLEPYLRRVLATDEDPVATRVAKGWLEKLALAQAAREGATR